MPLPASEIPTRPSPKRSVRKWVWHIARLAVLVYAGVAAVVYSMQNSLIFPGASTQGQRDAILLQGTGNELPALRAKDGTGIAALFGGAMQADGQPRTDVHDRPTVIFFYGNGACMAYSTDEFDHLRRLGANVIIPDYEGYGMSGGKPSEAGCYGAADAAYAYLLSRSDIDAKKIVAMGWSLGGATAIDLASRRPVAELITVSAFTSMRDMAHLTIPWLPTSLLVKYRFDNQSKLSTISCPIMIVHGTDDELIPFTMAARIAAAAKGSVRRINIQGAGHNNVFDVGGNELWSQVGEFLGRIHGYHE